LGVFDRRGARVKGEFAFGQVARKVAPKTGEMPQPEAQVVFFGLLRGRLVRRKLALIKLVGMR